jgi:hypothetical protein
MNEKYLWELWAKCKHPHPKHGGGDMVWPMEFAESIVKECMTMCDTVSADYLKHRKGAVDFQDKNIYAEGEAACDIIKYKMKKHFGVDE